MPERYQGNVSQSDYGEYPENYAKILKDYLIDNLLNHDSAKIEFVNKPSKMSIKQIGNIYTGYRICLSINSKNSKNIYTGYKTHLFVIKNNRVDTHLYDSGLLKIPFELCVDRNESKILYLDDIPDMKEEVTIDEMDKIEIEPLKNQIEGRKSDIYVLCKFSDTSRTFVFNENLQLLSESIGIDEILYSGVKYSNTHIYGKNTNEEILINRVSGEASVTTESNQSILGNCELLDKRKF
tara:strand:+ start:424 stop:1137 length:714 start_codon:yes stop_codon:yes gene_type:complete